MKYLLILILSFLIFLPTVYSKSLTKKQINIQQLANLQDQVNKANQKLREVETYQQCLTEQNRFQTKLDSDISSCNVKYNIYTSCVARVRDRQSSNTGKGALIGLGAAVLTGGATLLFTGAGALVGHSTSDEAPNECGNQPDCTVEAMKSQVKSETGLTLKSCQKPN